MRYRLEDEPRSARPSRPRSETDVQFELGPRSLIIFMGCLAVLCGLFYALGYTVGRHAAPLLTSNPAQTPPAMAQPISYASAPGFTSANPSNQGNPANAQPPNPANLSQAEQGQVPNSTNPAPVYAATANSNALGDSSLALPTQSQPAPGSPVKASKPNPAASAPTAGN